jgi:quercetin dioxygenase-like cupin family protein
MTRSVVRAALAPFLCAALLVAALTGGNAQEPPGPGGARFTGKQTMLESASSQNLRAARVRFEAGTRSFWHSHETGQLLFVQEGRALVQRRGEPVKELRLHESDYTGSNVVHWHGAAPDTHAVLTTVAFGGTTQWMEEVSETQYRGQKK